MGLYRTVAVETYRNPGEPSSAAVRVRPLLGQGLATDSKVEFSKKLRMKHALGTVFLVRVQVTEKEGGTPFLYTSWQWPVEIIDREEAHRRIAQEELK